MVSAGSGLQIAGLTVEIDGLKAFFLLPQAFFCCRRRFFVAAGVPQALAAAGALCF